MRKFTRIQKRLLTIIVVLCILACAMFGLRQNSITNIGYSAWTYLKYGLIQYPLSSIGNAVNDFSNLWHAYDDNEYLTKQLAQQKNYQTAYEDERNKLQVIIKNLDKDTKKLEDKIKKESDSVSLIYSFTISLCTSQKF